MSNQGDYHQPPSHGSYDSRHHQHDSAPQHQQAWQAAYQGMAIDPKPSFEDTRSSTPLEVQYASNRLRASSGTSSSSANVTPVGAPAQPYHPYRRHPGNMKRSRSSDGDLSAGARSAGPPSLPLVSPSNVPAAMRSPSDTVIQTPSTADQYRERPRVESNGSTDSRSSIIEKGKVGVAVRTGRIPVPKLMNVTEGMQSMPGQTQRSVSTPVASNQATIGTDVANRSTSNQELSNSGLNLRTSSHKRQSSSTSSVGAVVRPTLNQGGSSSFINGNSASTPPMVIASSSAKIPLAPVVSPERPTRTTNMQSPAMLQGKAESSASGGGLKGRLQRALNKNSDKDKASGLVISSPIGEPRQGGLAASGSAPSGLRGLPAPSSRSVSNPQQPQSQSGLQSHSGLGYRRPSNSSFAPSFIEPLNGNAGKGKRNLFSMRNASTDNISIGSTVSSASMMIRKMGALGKLARRNRWVLSVSLAVASADTLEISSMAGISRIFKNRDGEDGVIVPEPKMEDDTVGAGKPKKEKKKKKSLFGGSKSQPADSTTNFASANGVATDGQTAEDLTPAAKLARQHTLRTKTEEARRAAAAARANRQLPPAAAYGDESTVQRQRSDVPGDDADVMDAVAAQLSEFSLNGEDSQNAPSEIDQYGDALEMTEDYEGEYDEDGMSMNGVESEDDGEYVWGRSYRDRHAVPTRGILKSTSSFQVRPCRRFSYSFQQEQLHTTRYPVLDLHHNGHDREQSPLKMQINENLDLSPKFLHVIRMVLTANQTETRQPTIPFRNPSRLSKAISTGSLWRTV